MSLDSLLIIKSIFLIFFVAFALYALNAKKITNAGKIKVLIFWFLVPPILFYFEYYFQARQLDGIELEIFKDLQSRASQIWAGLAALLTIMYFKNDKKIKKANKVSSADVENHTVD